MKNIMDKIHDMIRICQDDIDLRFVEMQLDTFPNYVNSVINHQVLMNFIREREVDPEKIRDRYKELDTIRHHAHEAAIAAVSSLNRHCEQGGIEKFADIDCNNREQVAEFCGRYVNEIFNNGIGRNHDRQLDKAVERAEGVQYGRIDSEIFKR